MSTFDEPMRKRKHGKGSSAAANKSTVKRKYKGEGANQAKRKYHHHPKKGLPMPKSSKRLLNLLDGIPS